MHSGFTPRGWAQGPLGGRPGPLAHQCCFSPSAAQYVWEPAVHVHGPHDWLLRLFCHHFPGNQGIGTVWGGGSEVTWVFFLPRHKNWVGLGE